MTEWSRSTPWRQGTVLTRKTVELLGLHDRTQEDAVVVVISHDCDLVATLEREPDVELIVGYRVQEIDGNFAHAKSAHVLQLEFTENNNPCTVELRSSRKLTLPKSVLADHNPAQAFLLNPNSKSILQRWLAARYRRAAFPDQFVERLNKNAFRDKLGKIMKSVGKHIRAIFFDVDQGEDIDRSGPDDIYKLGIVLVYATNQVTQEAEQAALAAQREIEIAFKNTFWNEKCQWQFIELVDCMVISDEALSYAQSLYFREWRLEHISLRENPPQAMMGG